MTTQGKDEFVSGYSLGGDGRQLDSITATTPEQQKDAVRAVCRRYRGEEAWEVLATLGLSGVAAGMLTDRGRGSAA